MAILFDATAGGGFVTSDPQDWTHTPGGTPRGIIVGIVHPGSSGGDGVVAVTYGGVTMTEVSGSPLGKATGESATVYVYFLGSSVPTGPQTVSVDKTGAIGMLCRSWSVTATDNTEVIDTTPISSDDITNPSATLSLAGRNCFCIESWFSGHTAVDNVSPFANWNDEGEQDFGLNTGGHYRYTVIGTTNVTMGATQTLEDFLCLGIAIAQIEAAAIITKSFGFIY